MNLIILFDKKRSALLHTTRIKPKKRSLNALRHK